jgi:hypothetical protein
MTALNKDPKSLADTIIESGQKTHERAGEDLQLLEAVSWLALDVVNGAKLTPSVRKVLLGYYAERNRRVHVAHVRITVEIAHTAGYSKSIRDDDKETAYSIAGRLHNLKPNSVRKLATKKVNARAKR